MHKRVLTVVVVLVALVVALPVALQAGGDHDMEAWARAMTPGQPHADLAKQAGVWSYVVTIWEGPKAEPMTNPIIAYFTVGHTTRQ